MYRISTHHVQSCSRLLPAMLLAAVLLVPAAPAQGAPSWRDVCDELPGVQHYDVETMVADCEAAEEPEACEECDLTCPDLWADWVACRQNGGSEDDRVAAMACKVCHEGKVNDNGAGQVLFVNPGACNAGSPPGGGNPSAGHTDPYCTVEAAVLDAHTAQIGTSPLSTKIALCPAVYREEIDEIVPAAASSPPAIILESVVQHEATISASEEWNTDWQPASPPDLSYQNLLHYSEDFSPTSAWTLALNGGSATPVSIPGPAGPNVPATQVTPVPGQPAYLVYFGNGLWGTGRHVLSVYVKVTGRAQVGFRLGGDGTDSANYLVSLPPAPCTAGPFEGADGFGYEELDPNGTGDPWYRIWVADSLLTDKTTMAAHETLDSIRIDILEDPGYPTEYQQVSVWGAQLEHRPVGSFATEPRAYVPTSGAPGSGTEASFPVWESAGWTRDWGTQKWKMSCPGPEPTIMRRELLFIDGEPLSQVLNKDDMVPGSFFIDDGLTYQDHTLRWPAGGSCPGTLPEREGECSSESPCSLYVAPADDQPVLDPGAGYYVFDRLEVAERTKTFWLKVSNNWTIRGLRFQHAAGDKVQGGSVFFAGQSMSFTDNLVEHNSGTGFGLDGLVDCKAPIGQCEPIKGLKVYASGTYLARNRAFDNGLLGASLWNQQDVTVEDEHYARNNWRGLRVGHYGGFVGGAKMGWIDGGVFAGMLIRLHRTDDRSPRAAGGPACIPPKPWYLASPLKATGGTGRKNGRP